MICEYCGAPMDEGTVFCTECGAVHSSSNAPVSISGPAPVPRPEPKPQPKPEPRPAPAPEPPRRRESLHPAVRVLLNLCTVVLCLVLSASLVVTALVMDLQRLTSEKGLTALTEDLLWQRPQDTAAGRITASLGGLEVDIGELPSDTEGLADMIYDALAEEYGAELQVTPDQLKTFAEESTAIDFVTDKVASYAGDLVTGSRDTTIETDEILDLIDENLDLVEDTFNIQVDRSFRDQVRAFMEQNDINGMIRDNILDPISEMEIPGLTPLLSALSGFTGTTATVADLMAQLQVLTSGRTVTVLVLINVILLILLVLTNRLRLGPILVSAGIPALTVGVLLSLPVAMIQLLPVLVGDSLGLATVIVDLIGALAGRMAPVHYGIALTGLALVVAGAIVKAVAKKQKAALS